MMKILISVFVISMTLNVYAQPMGRNNRTVEELEKLVSQMQDRLTKLESKLAQQVCFEEQNGDLVINHRGAELRITEVGGVAVKSATNLQLTSKAVLSINGALVRLNNGNRQVSARGDHAQGQVLGNSGTVMSILLPGANSTVLIP